jgi:hypothetical protein
MSCRSCDLTLRAHVDGPSVGRPRAERVAKSSKTAAVKCGSAMKSTATTKMSASSAATEVGAAAESAASKSASAATGPCRMA